MMDKLFVYGSLMDEEIMQAVTGLRLVATPAGLTGYRRFCMQGEDYPGLIASPGGRVSGKLYLIPDLIWLKLDAFEGEEYERIRVDLVDHQSKAYSANTYLFRAEYRVRLCDAEWDESCFDASARARFMRRFGLR